MKSDSLWSFLFSLVDFIESISDHQGAELTQTKLLISSRSCFIIKRDKNIRYHKKSLT